MSGATSGGKRFDGVQAIVRLAAGNAAGLSDDGEWQSLGEEEFGRRRTEMRQRDRNAACILQ